MLLVQALKTLKAMEYVEANHDKKIGRNLVMENNEELVTNVTENVEELTTEELVDGAKVGEETVNATENEVTTEEAPKLYTEEDFNKKLDEVLAKKIARKEAKLRKEYEEKYADDLELAYITKHGIGIEDTKEAKTQMRDFYSRKNIDIPKYERGYSQREEELLANAEVQDIISYGYDDIVEEVDRLANIGVENMTPREKLVFQKLAVERQNQEAIKELASIGVGKEALDDADFKEFSSKLNPNLSVKEKYEMYSKFKPKPKVEQIGSMKGVTTKDTGVKDFYSYEESLKFTKEDFDRNPKLFEAVEKSMLKW